MRDDRGVSLQDSELLLTLAEVAVAFAGFASLVSILGRRSARDDSRINSIRMRAMVLYSLMVVAFSLVPFFLQRYGLSDPAIWRASSALFAGSVAVTAIWLVRQVLRARSLELSSRRPFVIAIAVPIPTLTIAALLLAANISVIAPAFAAAVYLTGLGLLLFLAGFAFSLIIFSFLGHVGFDG